VIYHRGQLFIRESEVYILSNVATTLWCLVCINDGNRWTEPVSLGRANYNHQTHTTEINIPDNSPLWGHYNEKGWVALEDAELELKVGGRTKRKRIRISKKIKEESRDKYRRIVL
jgi:hypothetical protein